MMHLKLGGTLTALLLMSGISSGQAADKLTDPQIAHIAYTAGVIDIKNAELALQKSKTKKFAPSRTTWSATTKPSTIKPWRSSRS